MNPIVVAGDGTFAVGRRQKTQQPRPASTAITRRAAGPVVIVSSAVAAQAGDGMAVTLFALAGPLAVGGLRFLAAAVVLLCLARPALRGRTRREWLGVAGLGCVAVLMNLTYYEAAARLPLGTTSTIEFLGPFAIAAIGAFASRSAVELGCALLAAGGVAVLSAASLHASPLGLIFAAASACALAGYVLISGSLAKRSARLDTLALAVGVSAIATLPLAGSALVHLDTAKAGQGLLSGVLGIGLVYVLERRALRLTSAKTVSVLLSLEPAVAALVGLVVLGQHLTTTMLAGIGCVLLASTAMSARSPVN